MVCASGFNTPSCPHDVQASTRKSFGTKGRCKYMNVSKLQQAKCNKTYKSSTAMLLIVLEQFTFKQWNNLSIWQYFEYKILQKKTESL